MNEILGSCKAQPSSDCVTWSREEVSVLLKQIVQEQFGVSDEQYSEDAHFIKDLGMG